MEVGSPDLPACVFIHGLGMCKHMWADPDSARIMGGMFPLRVMLAGYGSSLRTTYHDLWAEGFTVMTWSQHRPVGPAMEAVEELRRAVALLGEIPHKGLVLIGHSRGGLIARAAMAMEDFLPAGENVAGLVTLCSPHGGSGLSRWAEHVGRLTSLINSHIKKSSAPQGGASDVIKRLLDFIESQGVREVLPDSAFLRSLPLRQPEGVYCLSVGGTDPSLVSLPGGLSFPASLEAVFPDGIYPHELAEGKGDGLVMAESACLPFADEHMDFHVNHAAVAVDPDVRAELLERIKRCSIV